MSSQEHDLGGITLIVKDVKVGATAPGQEGSASSISSTELGVIDGVTAGTVTASKAVVVDANKDVSSFRDVTVRNLAVSQITIADAKDVVLDTTTGTKVGTATGQKLGFHNATPVVQRAGAAQAAVVTTAATQTTPYGFATQAQADALVTLVNELRAALVEKGLIKGSA